MYQNENLSVRASDEFMQAATEGRDWEQSITSKHSLACVATSGHSMPSFIDAANQIISDVINYCKVQ